MIKLINKIAGHPKLIIALLLLTAILSMFVIGRNARLETDLDEYMPKDHPAFLYSDEMEDLFGIGDNILLALEHPETIYNSETLQKIKDISLELPKRFPGIGRDDITSLYTAENITADEWGLTVEAFYDRLPLTDLELEELRVTVESNEMIYGRTVSLDGRAALIVAQIEKDLFTDEFYLELQEFAREYETPERIHIAGRPVVEGELTKLGPQDMARMAPLVIIFITAILLLLLKSIRNTFINLTIVLMGTLVSFGLMALFRVPVYTVTTMIPVMLTAIGVAYGIHMHNSMKHLVQKEPEISKEALAIRTLKEMVRPVSMTALTTAIGFMALMTSQVLPVRYFGLFTAIGVLTEMVMALILFPASIYLLGVPKIASKPVKVKSGKDTNDKLSKKIDKTESGKFSYWFGRKLLDNSRLVIVLVIIVVGIAIFGATRVWIDTSFLANFQKDSPVVKTDDFVNERFGGTTILNVILSSDADDTFKDPEVLELVDRLQERVEKNPLVGDSFGLADFLKRMNQVMHDDDPEYNRIPETRDMVAQYLLLYEMSGDPDNLDSVIDYDYKEANLTVRMKSDSSARMEEVIEDIEAFIPSFKELGINISYAGSGYKSLVFATLLLEGQVMSLLLSFLIVAVLLAVVFKNIMIGIVGTIPIMITAVVNFGTMGLLGIPLSSATALISAIAIGIGVDYAIHLIGRYKTNLDRGLSSKKATFETLSHTGQAIIYNTIAVMGGFAVLLISLFPPNRQVGGLIALNMAVSAIGTLTILVLILKSILRAEEANDYREDNISSEESSGQDERENKVRKTKED